MGHRGGGQAPALRLRVGSVSGALMLVWLAACEREQRPAPAPQEGPAPGEALAPEAPVDLERGEMSVQCEGMEALNTEVDRIRSELERIRFDLASVSGAAEPRRRPEPEEAFPEPDRELGLGGAADAGIEAPVDAQQAAEVLEAARQFCARVEEADRAEQGAFLDEPMGGFDELERRLADVEPAAPRRSRSGVAQPPAPAGSGLAQLRRELDQLSQQLEALRGQRSAGRGKARERPAERVPPKPAVR